MKKKVEENTDLKYEKATDINTQEVNYENLEKREKTVKNEISDTISEDVHTGQEYIMIIHIIDWTDMMSPRWV